MAIVKLKLNGLTCGSCEKSVTGVLKGHDNVKKVIKVNLTSAEIDVDPLNDAVVQSIITEIVDIGYEAVRA